MRRGLCLSLAVAVVGLVGPVAQAAAYSSGSLTNAYANADWTKASFNVSVTGTPCLSGFCEWRPIVMAQPNLPSYSCKQQEWGDSDPNTQQVWLGPAFTTNTSYSTAVTDAAILNRVVGQRLCLEVFGQNEHVSPVCESQKKVFEEFFHEPAAPCPPEKFIFSETVGGATLTLAPVTPSAVPSATTTPPALTTAPGPPPKTQALQCPKSKRKVTRHGKQICVKKRHKRASKSSGKKVIR
jgi:hypothetical protein